METSFHRSKQVDMNNIFNWVTNLLQKMKACSHQLLASAFVPLADYGGSQKLSTLFNNDANLVTYLNTAFKIAVSIGAILAVLRLLYAGYMYMASDVWTSKETAKGIFRDVFLGLFLLLAMYIILAQINPNLLNLNPEITPIKPSEITGPPQPPVSCDQAALDRVFQDESRVWGILRNAGITRNRGQCTSTVQRSCTSLGGLGEPAIRGLSNLKSDCQRVQGVCPITVTGGTEWWLHSVGTSHRPGNSVVDIAPSTSLNSYLLGSGITPSSGTRVTKNNAQYTYETTGDNGVSTGNHWHVVFN